MERKFWTLSLFLLLGIAGILRLGHGAPLVGHLPRVSPATVFQDGWEEALPNSINDIVLADAITAQIINDAKGEPQNALSVVSPIHWAIEMRVYDATGHLATISYFFRSKSSDPPATLLLPQKDFYLVKIRAWIIGLRGFPVSRTTTDISVYVTGSEPPQLPVPATAFPPGIFDPFLMDPTPQIPPKQWEVYLS